MPLREILDLERAFRRVEQDKRDDAWPDVVGYRDYRLNLEHNLRTLQAKIAEPNNYQASLPLGIDLPKQGFTLRPGIVPLIDDRMLYQSIADTLATHFEAEPCVYSNRLSDNPNSRRMFLPGVYLWLQFQDRIAELCEEHPYMVKTDITAYFDHIQHDILLHRIEDLFREDFERQVLRSIKQLLHRLLHRWSYGRHRFGIPQMNDASSFFGNLYLDELDKCMLRRRYIFLRYVDDICIFANDEPDARKALAELIVELRSMGLYVASAKTAIRETEDFLNELGEGRRRMDPIEEALGSGIQERFEQASEMLEDFFMELILEPDRFDGRQFRYCINRFKRLHATNTGREIHDRVVNEVLSRLASMPHSTDVFTDYLSLFPDEQFIQNSVLGFLESPYNIYPWQEMVLLELLIRSNIGSDYLDRTLAIAREAAERSKHPACRAKALILWGKNGDYADRREIRRTYYDESRNDVQRAIIVAIQEMQAGERDNFFRTALSASETTMATANYIQTLEHPTYHYYNPPPGYELLELYEDSDDLEDLSSEDFLY